MTVVVSSTQNEIVLGDPMSMRVIMRGVAIVIALVGFGLVIVEGGDLGDLFYTRLAILTAFFGALAILFAALPAKVRRVITINDPPGLLAVTSRTAAPLGAWPFLLETQWVRLRDAVAGALPEVWEDWAVTPDAVTQVRRYTLTVPTETGNSLALYGGTDHNVALHILARLRAAPLLEPLPAGTDAAARDSTVRRQRRLFGGPIVFALLLPLPLLAFAIAFRVFGDEPACPAGYVNHGVITPDWETVVENGLQEDREYVSCMRDFPARTTITCPPGDITMVSFCWRPLLVPKFPLTPDWET